MSSVIGFAARNYWQLIVFAVAAAGFFVWTGAWLMAWVCLVAVLALFVICGKRWTDYHRYSQAMAQAFEPLRDSTAAISPDGAMRPIGSDTLVAVARSAGGVIPPESLAVDHRAVLEALKEAGASAGTVEADDPGLAEYKALAHRFNQRVSRLE
jgi:hypothetical protein